MKIKALVTVARAIAHGVLPFTPPIVAADTRPDIVIICTDIAPDYITFADVTGEKNEALKKVSLSLAPGAWHTLTLKFDGINLDREIGGTKFSATDKIFEREKGGVDFLLTEGKVGFRNFSLTPAAKK